MVSMDVGVMESGECDMQTLWWLSTLNPYPQMEHQSPLGAQGLLIFLNICVFCLHVYICILYLCLVPARVGRRCWNHWNYIGVWSQN